MRPAYGIALIVAAAAALTVAACSSPIPATGPSPLDESVLPLVSSHAGAQFVPGPNTCPHDVPANWRVIGGDTSAKFRFDPVPGALMYTIEVREYEGHLIEAFATEHADDLKRNFSDGRYEARIQTRVCGPDGESLWSAWDDFTVGIDSDTTPTVVAPRIDPRCAYCHPNGIPPRRTPAPVPVPVPVPAPTIGGADA